MDLLQAFDDHHLPLFRFAYRLTGSRADAEHASGAPSPECEAMRGELADRVIRAVTQLPETQREVLILAHYEQLALAEIARITDLELGAVKSRLQRARASLKETLAVYAEGK